MDIIYPILYQLRSTDKDTRLRACKGFLHASGLSPEAVYALGLATLDSDRSVAWAARLALLVHRLKLKKIATILAWAVGVVVGLVAIWLLFHDMFITINLTCEKEISGAVDCVEQPRYFDLIPLPTKVIKDVRSVDILVITDDDDLELYNLELTTGSGKVELDSGYSYNYRVKRKMADQLEGLLNSATKPTLVIHDHGYLTWSTAVILCGFPIAFLVVFGLLRGLSELRNKIFPPRHKAKLNHPTPVMTYSMRQQPDEPKIYLQKKWGKSQAHHETSSDQSQPKGHEPGKLN